MKKILQSTLKLLFFALLAVVGLLLGGSARAATMTASGTAPTPGLYDISQLLYAPQGTANNGPPPLNYYNNGGSQGYPGDSFLTGNDASGYLLNKLVIKSATQGSATTQPSEVYTLRIYQLSGPITTAPPRPPWWPPILQAPWPTRKANG